MPSPGTGLSAATVQASSNGASAWEKECSCGVIGTKTTNGIRGSKLSVWLGCLAALLASQGSSMGQPKRVQISFDSVIVQAQSRAAKPHSERRAMLPEGFRDLNYDTYRQIQFRHDRALWEGSPFRLEFFHLGYLYGTPVTIHEFTGAHAQTLRFSQDLFHYGGGEPKKRLPSDLGYAGFRLLHPLNEPNKWDEIGSFLGSSYFRLLGKGQSYGTSARGLAIDSGEPGVKEEFPVFTQWWLEKPSGQTKTLRLYALLESASCTGAYEFLIHPGEMTVADISAVLFWREESAASKTIGLAPLTSMHWFGENSVAKPDDYRAEVHDCDGLLMREAEESFTWRPIVNPAELQFQRFSQTNLRGFGLMQRDRAFANYQDTFNRYDRTPSVWVEPRGEWGEGELCLVEMPTRYEGDDNVVAYWNPKAKPSPGQPFRFSYTLHWGLQPDARFPVPRVLQTRIGADHRDAAARQVMIDFERRNGASEAAPELKIESSKGGVISGEQVFANEIDNTWRVIFLLKIQEGLKGPVDVTCQLASGPMSEKWTYRWSEASKNLARR